MLKVGITYSPSTDLFTSGSAQTSILLVELFKELSESNYDITLIDTKTSDVDWWPDFPRYENVTLSQLHKTTNLDILIDIDGYVNPSYRKKIAKKSVVFMRTFLQFSEMDMAAFSETRAYRSRNFEGISEIWCWDILNPPESFTALKTLFNCHIRTVPFIWSSSVATHFSKGIIPTRTNNDDRKWTVHIAEKNNVNSSSSVFALVAVRELYLKSVVNADYKCHNMSHIIDHKFLVQNVLDNIKVSTLPVEFVKKEAFHEWLTSENSVLFSHSRFIPLRTGLINALWMGLPLIHNSPVLKSIHPQLDKMFYFGNEITSICSVFKEFSSNPDGFYSSLSEIQGAILKNWSISSNLSKWQTLCSDFFNNTTTNSDMNINTNNTNTNTNANTNTNTNTNKLSVDTVKKAPSMNKPFIVAFLDMWEGFNYNSNFIVDALREECKKHNLKLAKNIRGVKYDSLKSSSQPNIVIFSPFSKEWKDIPASIPKVFFTGENWEVPKDDSISLYLTPYKNEDNKHIRCPVWMMFIDWFSEATDVKSVNNSDNPNRLPVKMAMLPHTKSFNDRKDFCAFVVSNPVSKFRNDAFLALDSYKKVSSGGDLYNNIGGRLELKYPGGGGGDIPKYNFLSNHKFSLSFENSQAPGYITEKVLHAKMGGCVPLYWGDSETDTDFVPGSFINVSQLTNPEQIVKVVQKLEQNPEICAKIAATPILNEEKKQKALATISRISKKILELAGVKINEEVKEDLKLEKINKTFIVNLDTRQDRWQSLMKAEPYLENNSIRVSAVNGKTLKLDTTIYNIFKNNRFSWKKSVMGCFLSHLDIWTRIINDNVEDNTPFLVLEDDVRFDKDWADTWNKCVEDIPKDAELLYIGGVLPPNKAVLPTCLEQVNQYWSQIRPNMCFSPGAFLPIFHFCTYSYVITKSGAKKLLNFINTATDYQTTECDHFLGNHIIGLNKYVLTPLICHCFQDEDETYINSQFNDVNHTKSFDSDICNNTECFTDDEIEPFRSSSILDESKVETVETVGILEIPKSKEIDIYYFNNNTPYELYEIKWIKEIFGKDINLIAITSFLELVPNNSWFIVQRPHLPNFNKYFTYLQNENINFKVLHLSDEFSADDLKFYNYTNCKGVIRNYIRNDTPGLPYITTVPIGFHYKGTNSKTFNERSMVWSFHGTDWFNRKDTLEKLQIFVPNNCHFTNYWNDPKMTNESKYLNALSNSKFCPILRGNNIETFRLYEALETGTIPIYVRIENDAEFWNLISKKLQLINLDTWEKAIEFITFLLDKKDFSEKYRLKLVENWRVWKDDIKATCQKLQ
jgi:GR25 family glycosyltransferase involved in LPS biosynthesis